MRWRTDDESFIAMDLKQSFWPLLPPRIRRFFGKGPEAVIESNDLADVLTQRIRESFAGGSLSPAGACGYVRGNRVGVGWATGLFRDSFAPVFRGRIEATSSGSRIVGHMSHDRIAQGFLAVWCGGVIFISLVGIWTIIMPLAGWGLLWLANGMLGIGDYFYPNRRESILEHLRSCAAGTSSR